MKKRAKKLVPLMPILVRLGACRRGVDLVEEMNARSFQEAWRRCHHVGHLAWLAYYALYSAGRGDPRLDRLTQEFIWEYPDGGHVNVALGRRALEGIVSPAEVERALYDYAVREGLVS